MHMNIHESLKVKISEAMRARDTARLNTLRSLLTAMTNELIVKKRKPNEFLSDDEALAVIKRAANQRKESARQFEAGGRPELAETENEELKIISSFLPEQMPKEEIKKVVQEKIQEMNITDSASAGKLIGMLMKDFKGRADGNEVKDIVASLLP
ncbi:MAG TPA: GatB/YqeY domain-containing protein [Candidatus Kaiserbacteria bacterium]|nr:GatB/YqeY domain-containing protein [Candidatus Kaiserbacteria bacterium]